MVNSTELKSVDDMHKIGALADRAMKISEGSISRIKIDWFMDFETVHETIGLRLDDLLNASAENFIHDMYGIYIHLDRHTKKLGQGFSPRYACQDKISEEQDTLAMQVCPRCGRQCGDDWYCLKCEMHLQDMPEFDN